MKKIILISTASILLIIGGVSITGCSNSSQNNNNTDTIEVVKTDTAKIAAKYQCPMKCEGDKTYDKPGKCPVCGMNIKKIETY